MGREEISLFLRYYPHCFLGSVMMILRTFQCCRDSCRFLQNGDGLDSSIVSFIINSTWTLKIIQNRILFEYLNRVARGNNFEKYDLTFIDFCFYDRCVCRVIVLNKTSPSLDFCLNNYAWLIPHTKTKKCRGEDVKTRSVVSGAGGTILFCFTSIVLTLSHAITMYL